MGFLFNLSITPQLKFLCSTFNRYYLSSADRNFDLMAGDINAPSSYSNNLSKKEKAVFMTLINVIYEIKQNNRHEFRRYSIQDIQNMSQGRFELLGFIAAHTGSTQLMDAYYSNPETLRKDLRFIYDYMSKNAPKAITLDFESFFFQAHLWLSV